MAEWLVAWGETHGFETTIQTVFPGRRNVNFHLRNGADTPHLLLNGHTDTVAVSEMTIPPFGAELREGRIWGRGSTDMKGPLACMLHTLLVLRDEPASWRGKVTLACVVDEELGFAGIRHFLTEESAFDFALVGEPTKLEVVRGCKGCLRFFVRAHGQSAHSSTPDKGVSAITAMAGAITAMNQYFSNTLSAICHPSLGSSTGSIGIIRGGTGVNIVPEFCEVLVDIRLVPGQSWQETYAEIQRVVNGGQSEIRWEFEETPLADTPFCLEADHPVVQSVCAGAGRKESQVVNFSCDASKIAALGIPCLIFGPGDIANAHTADESIAVSELEDGVKAYLRIARQLLAP
jgi:acetylornithine deacetylase/succinyl-diaminopimelate desuccinylase-like protein